MNLRLVFLALSLGAAGTLRAAQSYALESHLYVYRDADFHRIVLAPGDTETSGKALAFRKPVEASFDGARVSVAGDAITWSTGAPPAPLSFVPTPQVLMDATRPVALNSSVEIQYMEPQPDGSLKVHTVPANTPDAPHYRVRISLADGEPDAGTLTVGCTLDIETVRARAAVQGVSLPVGKPEMATLSKQLTLRAQPDEWTAVTVRQPNGSDYSLLLFLKFIPEVTGETQLNRSAVAHLKVPRMASVVVADERYIYVAGGRNYTGILDSLERFDTVTGESTLLPVKLRPRKDHAGALLNGKLYLFGGEQQWRAMDNVLEIVDLATGKVTEGALMPYAPAFAAAAAVNGKIYAFGGITFSAGAGAWTSRVHVYDPAANTWSDATPMPSIRAARIAVVHDGQIIVPGGHRPPSDVGLKTVEAYHVEAGRWQSMKDLPVPFGLLSATSLDDRAFLFRMPDKYGTLYEYNLTTGAAVPLASNYTPVINGGAVTVGRTLYLVGGATSSGNNLAENASDEIQIFMPKVIR